MGQILFSNQVLPYLNKTGDLPKDDKGRYTVVLGMIGTTATCGDLYKDTPSVRKVFAPSGRLQDMISRGMCRGEWGHPKPDKYPNRNAFKARVRKIDEDRIAFHIYKVWIEEITYKGRKVQGIMGLIKPIGPYGSFLQQMLDDPDQNVAFSGRYFSDFEHVNGRVEREIHTVITWDFVYMPGMEGCEKYTSPNLLSDDADGDPFEEIEYKEQSFFIGTDELLSEVEKEGIITDVSMLNGGMSASELLAAAGMPVRQSKDMLAEWV